MRQPKKKRTISLAQYRKRKRTIGFATALACMAFCTERVTAALGQMGSSALKVGGLFYDDAPGGCIPLDETIDRTKAYIDLKRNQSNEIVVNKSLKELLLQQIKN